MTAREKMEAGLPYVHDDELNAMSERAKELCRKYNATHFKIEKRKKILEELFRKKLGKIYIEPPFHCDFGTNISVGDNFYANFNLVALDCGKITIGDNVMLAPNVQLYAVGHPIDPSLRAKGDMVSLAAPITIGNNVWIGGGSILLPGTSVGDNCVIGAGSVVTKDIPANTLAFGNPCREIKKI